MNEWQPIETAPKDGRILVYLPNEYHDERVQAAYWQHDCWFTGWMVWSCRSDGWEVYPTHWMPLPEPPK